MVTDARTSDTWLLITSPPFSINFQKIKFSDNEKKLIQKTRDVVLIAFQYVKFFFSSLYKSVILNLRYSLTSFRYIVIENIKFSNKYLGYFLAFWGVVHIIGIIGGTGFYFLKELRSQVRCLIYYANKEININHIKTKDISIDISNVPENINVENLIKIFDEINFTNPNLPGYIKKAGNIKRENLITFVRRIQQREAFLGTPPRYAMADLMRFYEQIEKAVLFSIYKVTNDFENFMSSRKNTPPQKDETEEYRKYINLLENKARLAIDLAIAGELCGARYMGDAMQAYFLAKGEGAETHGTLKETIYSLLSQKRKEIADSDIATYMTPNTHNFSAYMASLGKLLGIPGTENVIEYLGGADFNRHKMLEYFFISYTPKSIRDAVLEKYKISQEFREMVYEWLKDQVGGWKEEEYKNIADNIINDTNRMLKESFNIEETQSYHHINIFLKIFNNIHNEMIINADNWNDFVEEFFAIEQVKQELNNQIPEKDLVVKNVKRNEIKETVKENIELEKFLQKSQKVDMPDVIRKKITLEYKAKNINKILSNHNLEPMVLAVLIRALQNDNIEEIIVNHLQMMRKNEFLASLTLAKDESGEMEESSEDKINLDERLLNWILLSHGILQVV